MGDTQQKTRILVVDDSAAMRKVVRKFLINGGFADILEASDGQEALEQINKGGIDMIVSDLNMPAPSIIHFFS